ncbi:MAG: chromosome segregation protein SMC [Acidobacteriales bacterium 13_2_20CM_55_8]|nr:MAG: chromosome segregation protein SMC [Acidobacteriales bacterium 13_2_20CM_55_8]
MLKLKKLQILGFKSFCDRTELKFHGDGVAAIIGPNGCGKSNIADAISWVLGEQSAKTLRGSRMDDVIFAGTRDRKPTGMAEVSLSLIDPEVYAGADAHEPTEVEIRDDIPTAEDWDESEIRARAADETERLTEEAQPGRVEEGEETAWAEALSGSGEIAALKRCATQNPETFDSTQNPQFSDDTQNPQSLDGTQNPTSSEDEQNPESRGAIQDPAGLDGIDSQKAGPQVVLKIRRRKFNQQFRAGEIVVTRRLFRTGDSEYLLNGKLCRLRDIQELFMGTGLGPETYALIEQGRIGQILSSRPTDRRAIIEEAAGITKFKTKKRLAEARLEDAKQNLSRVNDIFEEVTRQMNSLKRQASKAERYARLRDEMRAKLRVVLASKFAQLDQESAELDAQITSLSEEMRQKSEMVQLLEAEHAERTQRGYGIESEIRENSERLNEIKLETDRAQAQRRHNEERCTELVQRVASSEAEWAQAKHRLTALEAERDSNRQILDSAAADLAAAQQELTQCQEEAAAAANELAQAEQQQEQCRVATLEAVASVSNLRNQLTQAEERLAAVDREGQRLQTEMATASSQVEAFGGQRGQLALEFETVSQRVSGLTKEIVRTRESLESKRRGESEAKNRLDGLRAEYASAIGKKGSLEAVIAEHGYSTESVRRLFQSGAFQGGVAPAGVLADFLEVDPRYEGVVEDFLRDELNYIVVKSWDAADEGLRLLRTDVDGRATFLVHPEDSQAKFSFVVNDNCPEPPHQSIIPLKHTIRVLNGFGKSLEVILPKLRDGYIVPDPGFARDLALVNPDAFFLSQSGECFHNVTVTGGKQRAEGPLSMKRELREVMRVLGELEQALRHGEMKVLTLGREIKELTSLLDRLEGEKREAEKQAMTSGHLLQQLDSEMSRVSERLNTCDLELRRLAAERDEQEALVNARQSEMSALEGQRLELERLTSGAQEQLASLRERRDLAAQNASQHVARVATLQERHRAAAAVLERIESLVEEMRERVNSLRAQIESSNTEKLQRENENETIGEQLIEMEAERNAGEARDGLLRFESEQMRARLGEIEESLRQVRLMLDQARDRRGEVSAAAAKLQSDAQYMGETCLNELGLQRQELMSDSTIPVVLGEQLAGEDQIYREMRARLDGMGPVNMMALEEYKETSERHTFLETQRKDLLESIENTQATIKEIDVFSRQKFEEAFHKINENFQATFGKLFGGGLGFMRLTDEENSAESGIDVVASPPGKKLQNVLLLSGGEKALTALALLVGIFQYQPSPFCILDEVDAPLDEANIGRFTELVKEMSVQTQFVLITHSKKTMSIAPVLYGVTMQEPGVSKLVSVRFGATA